MAYSILQGGPSFCCLSPCVYQYLCTESIDECYPVKDDVPLNIATHDMLTFIEEVSDSYQYKENIYTVGRLILDSQQIRILINKTSHAMLQFMRINIFKFLLVPMKSLNFFILESKLPYSDYPVLVRILAV